jgi:hypothetical protein
VLSQPTTTSASANSQATNPYAPKVLNGAPTMGPFRGNRIVTSPLNDTVMPAGPGPQQ